jgi:hypothetical protein
MARRATVEDIRRSGEKELIIPGLVDEAGDPVTLRVRKVHAGERMALLPPSPGHLFENLPEDPDPTKSTAEEKRKIADQRQAELVAREKRWLETLTSDQLRDRRLASADFCCRLVALASLDPVLPVEAVRALGDAALVLSDQILEFSQNKPGETKPGETPASPA